MEIVPHMPVQRFAAEYNMGHSKRGMAIIFNHENFQSKSLTPRTGTNSDCRKMRDALNQLQFDVVVHKDLRYDEIQDICGKCKYIRICDWIGYGDSISMELTLDTKIPFLVNDDAVFVRCLHLHQ